MPKLKEHNPKLTWINKNGILWLCLNGVKHSYNDSSADHICVRKTHLLCNLFLTEPNLKVKL